uniref:hypothetical protein n=1 Tax=Pleurosigma intermedium TaxID=197753 RepID=UPI002181FC8F|nr:hypothetical protein N4L43_pgp022 [Pleurosigma intermedium]UVG42098.1 hypothetical protein [Pleurosigma intermedium]
MVYVAALGSKSVALTLPGLIGYLLPEFYFFHMLSFYALDKLKPVCQIYRYTLGTPFKIVGSLIDGITSTSEEMYFEEEVLVNISGIGETIPGDIEDINKLREVFKDMKDFGKKTY